VFWRETLSTSLGIEFLGLASVTTDPYRNPLFRFQLAQSWRDTNAGQITVLHASWSSTESIAEPH
jgi:hypothetical protein